MDDQSMALWLRRIYQEAERRREVYIDLLQWLVEHETPSDRPDRIEALVHSMAERCQTWGLGVRLIEAPPSASALLAWYPPASAPDALDVLFLGHVDTVWPVGTLSRRPFRIEGTRVLGPGVLDMKGGIALVLLTYEILRSFGELDPQRCVGMLWTTDEEVGSPGCRPVVEAWARRARFVLCMEPAGPGGAVKVERYGVGTLTVTVQGRASHPGLRNEGVNAIEQAMALHMALRPWTMARARMWLTLTRIRGGDKTNQVPDTCTMTYDIRFADPEWITAFRRWLDTLHAVPPDLNAVIGEWSAELRVSTPPLPRQATREAFERARAIAWLLNWNLQGVQVGGGSDSAHAAAAGAQVLDGLGVEGGDAHGPDEWMDLEVIPRRIALIAGLWQTL